MAWFRIFLISLIWGAGSCAAETLELTPVADTTLFGFDPDANFGSEGQLIVGSVAKNQPNNRARLLIRFDVSSVPVGAIVTNVTLQVTVLKEKGGAPAVPIGLHRMLTNWFEGNRTGLQGSAALAGQSTWNSRAHQQLGWTAPGGLAGTDFGMTASSSRTLDGPGSYVFPSSSSLLSDVQSWVNTPSSNLGWILVSADESRAASARRIAARESGIGRPSLKVEYTLPPPPPQIVSFGSIEVGNAGPVLRFRALAGNVYSVWVRDDLGASGWRTLTNVSNKFSDQDAVVQDEVLGGARFYQLAITGQVD